MKKVSRIVCVMAAAMMVLGGCNGSKEEMAVQTVKEEAEKTSSEETRKRGREALCNWCFTADNDTSHQKSG